MRGAGLACDDTEALFQLLLFIHVVVGSTPATNQLLSLPACLKEITT